MAALPTWPGCGPALRPGCPLGGGLRRPRPAQEVGGHALASPCSLGDLPLFSAQCALAGGVVYLPPFWDSLRPSLTA